MSKKKSNKRLLSDKESSDEDKHKRILLILANKKKAQVDEIKSLMMIIARGKQKEIDPKDTIIDWTNDEINFSISTSRYGQPDSLKNMAKKAYSSKLDDQLLEKFYNDKIQPVLTDNRYHNPEVSEIDDESPSKRLSLETLRYNRSLKSYIGRFSNVNYSPICEDMNNIEEKDDSHNGNHADSFEKDNWNRERRSRSLVSTEYNSDYEKDDN
ncbi:11280_t:CDS:2 [Funneliformis caledonium]|uniref:11280_t:CDS:1 n=1 Tax=Funneliformis caledonium TaxID=1117310 RepID=A0A9N9F5U3_9GLOM|nr:11280_t:CDS:2 [Funneliformis caledonium]